MSQSLAVDQEYVKDQVEEAWNRWTPFQRWNWLDNYGFKNQELKNMPFKYQPVEIKDALFCEFLDNNSRDFEYDKENTLRQDL